MLLNDGSDWQPEQQFVDQLKKLYAGIELQAELRKMSGWCLGNPKRRKTRRGIQRFVIGWLNKAMAEKRQPRFQRIPDNVVKCARCHAAPGLVPHNGNVYCGRCVGVIVAPHQHESVSLGSILERVRAHAH